MKAYFSVSELFGMGLEILPSSERGIQKKVNRENWQFREVAGRGGKGGKKREYMPPPEVQAAIMRQQQEQVLATAQFAALPVAAVSDADTAPVADGSTEVQRQREGARLGVLNAIDRLMAETKTGRDGAITAFLVSAQHPDMPHLAHMLRLANDKRGGGAALPSKRTIHRWFQQREESGSLLPKVPQKDLSLPEWFKRFWCFTARRRSRVCRLLLSCLHGQSWHGNRWRSCRACIRHGAGWTSWAMWRARTGGWAAVS